MLDKILSRIKEIIGFEHFDNMKKVVGTDNKLPGDATFVILMTCVINTDDKFYSQLILEELLFLM